MARGLCNIKLYKAVSSTAIDAKYTVAKWVFSHSLRTSHTYRLLRRQEVQETYVEKYDTT